MSWAKICEIIFNKIKDDKSIFPRLALTRFKENNVMKFRKKPIAVDAFKFRIDNCPDWFIDEVSKNTIITTETGCHINTLEGFMTAQTGDYIIKGIKGEIYPCKPDIFAATYDHINGDCTANMKINEEIKSQPKADYDYDTLLNITADLSMRINRMQSSLREFEKQKVEPLTKSIGFINSAITNINISITDHIKRIEKLESSQHAHPDLYKSCTFNAGEEKECEHSFIQSELFESLLCEKCRRYESDIHRECKHDFGDEILLSLPAQVRCKKCLFLKVLTNECSDSHYGGHPRDTLKLCEHARPVKSACPDCNSGTLK